MLTGMTSVIMWEMFHGGISLNLVLLLLLVNVASGLRLELTYLSLILNIRSNLTHFHGFQLLVLLLQLMEITFFGLHQPNESSKSTINFWETINDCKKVLDATKLAHTNKTKESLPSQKFGLLDFWRIANNVLSKGKFAISSIFNDPLALSYWCSLRLKMLGKGVWLKNTAMLVFFLLLKKCLKNLWILGLMITEGNHSEFQRGFRSSWSTADLLIAAPDRIARAFNKSEATPAVALDISKAFKRVWHANLSYKLKFLYCSGIWPFWSFLRSSWPHVILNWKSSQEYPVNAGVP